MKKIIHIHIPKTGGSWLNDRLSEHFPDHFLGRRDRDIKLSSCVTNVIKNRNAVYAGIAYGDAPTITTYDHHDLSEFLKVSICRNPFDYLVSYYHHRPNDTASIQKHARYLEPGMIQGIRNINIIHNFRSFDEFIKKFCDPDFPLAQDFEDMRSFLFHQMFDNDGHCAVDVIMRNECLHSATTEMINGLKGTSAVLNKKRENVSQSRKKKDYRSYYTDKLRELVERKCMAELLLFEYDFDGATNENEFVDPASLFYCPIYPVAGKDLPRQVTALHAGVMAHESEAQTIQLQGIQHITPDVYVTTGDPTPEDFMVVRYAGNDGDPRPVADVLDHFGIPWDHAANLIKS
jgi:hypothetical protein